MQLSVRAFAEKDLDEVATAIDEGFAKFEKEGISEKDLNRIKAGQETQFYNSLSSVLGKGVELAQYNYLRGDPGFVEKDIKNILAVTPADVTRVYEKYIKGKNYVATSFVPKGKLGAGARRLDEGGSRRRKDRPGSRGRSRPERDCDLREDSVDFDRSVEPPYGPAPEVKIPAIWEQKLSNGMRVYGIENSGSAARPVRDRHRRRSAARRHQQGRRRQPDGADADAGNGERTPQELEEAIQQLGATINVSAGTEDVRITVNTLARNYDATLALVEEILLEPRWDAKEFDLVKQSDDQPDPPAGGQSERHCSEPVQSADLRQGQYPFAQYSRHDRFGQRDHDRRSEGVSTRRASRRRSRGCTSSERSTRPSDHGVRSEI